MPSQGYPRHSISLSTWDSQNGSAVVGLANPKRGTLVCSRGCILNNLIPFILLIMCKQEKCAINIVLEDLFILCFQSSCTHVGRRKAWEKQ